MIYTILADGFEEIEALCVVDILRRAQIDIQTVSINNTLFVTGAHVIEVKADLLLDDIGEYDGIFLPGGYPGYVNLESSVKTISLIKEAYSNNKMISAICAAPSILGKLGLLKDRDACCFPSFEEYLHGANVLFDDVCVSGNIITSRGAGTAHKLGFKLVELLTDKETSRTLEKNMIYS